MSFFLSFTTFEQEVLCYLVWTPSLFHPNSQAFVRAFQYVCRYLNQKASIRLFFHIFLVAWEGSPPPHDLIYFKQSPELFEVFTESLKNYKFHYVVIEPVTTKAQYNI